jgi:surface protein
MKNVPRWIFASVAEHFRVIAAANNIPYFVEGIDERDSDSMTNSHVECRVTGPGIKEIGNGYYHITPTINFLLTSNMDMTGDAYEIIRWAGILQEAMLAPIPIYKYGTGPKDTGQFLGCLRLKGDSNSQANLYHFGQMSPVDRIRQSEVDAVYELWLTEAEAERGNLTQEGGTDPSDPTIILPPSSVLTLVDTVSALMDYGRVVEDTLNLSSNVSRLVDYVRPLSQDLGLSSTVDREMIYLRSVSSNMALTQNAEFTQELDIVSSDLGLSSSVGSAIERSRSFTHNMGLTHEVVEIHTSPGFIATWNTEESGTSNSQQISLPLEVGGTYNFVANWGDGTEDTITSSGDPDATHTYNSPGIYEVTIKGGIDGWRFNNGGDKLKIYNISEWGPLKLGNNGGFFYGCSNLTCNAIDALDLSGTTTLAAAFKQCTSFNGTITNWNTANITSLSETFWGTAFNQDISSWNTANVASLKHTFYQSSFNQDISGWNTYKTTNMQNTFSFAASFNQPLNGWNTANVTNMTGMFSDADAFNQDLNSWNTHKVTNMSHLFDACTSFNGNVTTWNTVNTTNMYSMFRDCSAFNQDVGSWNTYKVTNFGYLFYRNTVFNQDIGSWNTGNVTSTTWMFRDDTAFDQDLGGWDVTALSDAANMLNGATLSTANYDSLLIGWEGQATLNSVAFHAGTSTKHSAGTANTARQALIDDHSWVITDGGQV